MNERDRQQGELGDTGLNAAAAAGIEADIEMEDLLNARAVRLFKPALERTNVGRSMEVDVAEIVLKYAEETAKHQACEVSAYFAEEDFDAENQTIVLQVDSLAVTAGADKMDVDVAAVVDRVGKGVFAEMAMEKITKLEQNIECATADSLIGLANILEMQLPNTSLRITVYLKEILDDLLYRFVANNKFDDPKNTCVDYRYLPDERKVGRFFVQIEVSTIH
jgi:hypothetical protein